MFLDKVIKSLEDELEVTTQYQKLFKIATQPNIDEKNNMEYRISELKTSIFLLLEQQKKFRSDSNYLNDVKSLAKFIVKDGVIA